MTTQTVLSAELKRQYESLKDAIQRCLSLTEKCGESEATAILRERLTHLGSAALLVIVGEVKSGKSSFVNALLGEEVCEVAPDPCTASIQELVYAEKRSKTILGDHWERIGLPQPVLREITIVDTPGTNSIIRNHQTITENYIPQSDLVVFVFSAKNPHTATAWDLLGLIRKEWHRKIVFVLQQADLATQHELNMNLMRVKQYARERNVQAPIVFALSAKQEMEGASDRGFAEFRAFLQNTIESGEVWRMKVEGGRDTLRRIISDLLAKLRKAGALLAEDKAFYQNLLARLEFRRQKAYSLRRLVVDNLCVTYDRLLGRLEEDFKNGLRIRTILWRSLPFIRDRDMKTWLTDLRAQFERAAREEIETECLRVSKDLSAEMTATIDELTQAVAKRQEGQKQVYIPQVADRTEILEQLSRQLRDLQVSDIVADMGIQGSNLGKLTLRGGGLATLGAVIAFLTHIIVLDIIGGILTISGPSLVVLTVLWKRSRIVQDFSLKLSQARQDFRNRLDQVISGIFDRLFLDLEHYLKEPLALLEQEIARIAPLIEEAEEIKNATEALCQRTAEPQAGPYH